MRTCADVNQVILGTAPVRRLTNVEYTNTLRELFGDLPSTIPAMPTDAVTAGSFENDALALGPSDVRIQRFERTAMILGERAAADPTTRARIVPCSAQTAACGAQFVREFGRRALRRPLRDDEEERYVAFFEAQRTAIDFDAAIELTIAAFLQSPQFLYRLEVTSDDRSDGRLRLTSYELASRLSYFLWESMPDEELFAAAEANRLSSDDEIAEEAERMLGDPRASAAIRNFHRQWLHLERVTHEGKLETAYPQWTPEVAAAAAEESARVAEEIVMSGGTLGDLLTTNVSYVNDALAPMYGVAAPPPGTWRRVELDPEQRSGVLSRIAFLAGHAHEANGSPPLRGVFVMERLLCAPRRSPPANADTSPPTSGTVARTNRQLFEERTRSPTCQGCHVRIDGFGFGFENYDTVGAYRTTDNGLPVDATGLITGTDQDGPYEGAAELQARLAESDVVERCVTEHWFRYAYGRGVESADRCVVERLARRMDASGGRLDDLLVAIVTSPEFRLRPATAE